MVKVMRATFQENESTILVEDSKRANMDLSSRRGSRGAVKEKFTLVWQAFEHARSPDMSVARPMIY
jgi:hypothetical protein